MKVSFIIKYFITFCLAIMLANNANAKDLKWSFVSDPFPPFADPGLKNNGIFWELTEAALKTQGIEATLHFAPFKRALNDSKSGKYDAIICATFNKEREKWFLYSLPVFIQKTVFFKLKERKDLVFDGSLKSLSKENSSIAVLRGSSMTEDFDNADYLNKIFLTHNQQSFAMLATGRADLVVSGLLNGKAILQKLAKIEPYDYENLIEVVQPSLKDDYYHIAFSRQSSDFETKTQIFNKGLMEIKNNGTFKSILEKYNLSPSQYIQ